MWAGAIVVVLSVLTVLFSSAWVSGVLGGSTSTMDDRSNAVALTTEGEAATPTTTPAGLATPPSGQPAFSTPVAVATPLAGGAPGATPQSGATPVTSDACAAGCLVRLDSSESVLAALTQAGERPSYESDDWIWAVVSRETVDDLQQDGLPVYLVHDSPETLYLYATRLPDGQVHSPTVEGFGEILDSVNGHSIVMVDAVPPIVTSLVDEGIWIEKLRPAPPAIAGEVSAGRGDSLANNDLGVLLPQVDVDEIWMTVTELQAMSSTDGTGIGTRQYSQPGNVMTAEYLFTRLETYGLEVWYEDFITWEGYLVSNVLGEIPGRDDSMVYGVMAHLDSTAVSFDEAPGADDNASGVAGTLEIARILSGYELEHPVHVIFVNAEETMIIGSMAYADGVVQNGTPIEGIFNLDTIANPVYGTRLILNSGPQSAWMTDLLIDINSGYGLGQDIRAYQSDAIISDDTMLRNQGIESVLVARLLADDYGVHHSADDTIEQMSFENTVSATQLVLLALGVLVQ